jgi:hypothetical protein
MSGLSGEMPTRYDDFAARAGAALDDLAGIDEGMSAALDNAAGADRSGRTDSGAVVAGAAADASSLAAVSRTPAGERALIVALRSRGCPSNTGWWRPIGPGMPKWRGCCGRWPTAAAAVRALVRRSAARSDGVQAI